MCIKIVIAALKHNLKVPLEVPLVLATYATNPLPVFIYLQYYIYHNLLYKYSPQWQPNLQGGWLWRTSQEVTWMITKFQQTQLKHEFLASPTTSIIPNHNISYGYGSLMAISRVQTKDCAKLSFLVRTIQIDWNPRTSRKSTTKATKENED